MREKYRRIIIDIFVLLVLTFMKENKSQNKVII